MARLARVATVGHVEWIEFVPVARVPRAGEIAHGAEPFSEPAGWGAVVAVQLARLAGESVFFTALGRDEHGLRARERLEQLGVSVRVAWRESPTRRALTLVDGDGERTIITLGSVWPPPASMTSHGRRWPTWTPCISPPVTAQRCVAPATRACWWPPRGQAALCRPASRWMRSCSAGPMRTSAGRQSA